MSNEENNIEFSFSKLKTTQFAVIESSYDNKSDQDQFSSSFEVNAEPHLLEISIKGRFEFLQNQRPFIIIEVSGFFNVTQHYWDSFYNKENNKLIFPKDFIIHLATLVTGAARGVLHVKTENTIFNTFILPTVNLMEMIKDDLVIDYIPINKNV